MKLSKFRFELPKDLIAQHPAKERDEARLMVVNRAKKKIEHKIFKDVLGYFNDKDVLVLNDTKVFPARLYGNKGQKGENIEVFLLRELNKEQKLWDTLVDPARKIRIGNKLYFGDNSELVAEVIDNTNAKGRTLRFLYDGKYEEFKRILYKLGETPLPDFINREAEKADAERYQTIFAKHIGAVAAPSAGLHFNKQLLKRLEIKGVDFAHITSHAGLGNFRTVVVEDLTKHKMDSEEIIITDKTVDIVNNAKTHGRQICAVGTTVIRALESSVSTSGELTPFEGWTNKFIFPPYDFKVPTSMITNFQMPETTLVITVAAFAGYDLLMKAYKEAIKEKYKFGSYGDAMLIL